MKKILAQTLSYLAEIGEIKINWEAGLIISSSFWLDLVFFLQAIALEDFEYYAVYDPNIVGVAIGLITFKPIEYLCEIGFEFFLSQSKLWFNDRPILSIQN